MDDLHDLDDINATNAERLVALAEIIAEQAPCDHSKVSAIKKILLAGFKKLAESCACGAEHTPWIQAMCEIEVMLKEVAAHGESLTIQ
jgi:hypothetical protein